MGQVVTLNGWHKQVVAVLNRAAGVSHDVLVTWRTQRVECCGSQPTLVLADAHTMPYSLVDPYGALLPQPRQCHGCGSLYSPDFSSRPHPYYAAMNGPKDKSNWRP